jgi:membrane protease YdiL (CAAX protease family)
MSEQPYGQGELCGVCAAPLRTAARFCGRCGAEQGFMVARDAGAGRPLQEAPVGPTARYTGGRSLVIALVAYAAALLPALILLAGDGVVSVSQIETGELAILGAAIAGVIVLGRPGWAALRLPQLRGGDVAIGLAGVAAVLGLVQGLEHLVPHWFLDDTFLFKLESYSLLGAILSAAILPAVAEELLFRGVIMHGLRGVFSDRTAIAVSAMMFATIHMALLSWPHLCLLGVLLGAARIRTGSVWPGVLLHALYNAAVLAIAW